MCQLSVYILFFVLMNFKRDIMADIKTHLRELSVATTVGLLKSSIVFQLEDLYDSKIFFSFAEQVITNLNLESNQGFTERTN